MLKAVIFDLDDTLLWDEKSVAVAFKHTCEVATQKYGIAPDKLEEQVRKHADALFPSYDVYPYVKNIGIGKFEAFWGNFQDEGESPKQLRAIISEYRRDVWTRGLADLGVQDAELAEQLAKMFAKERRQHIYVYDDTYKVLDSLKGTYKLLLLTNGSPDLQQEKLRLSPELKPYFDHIVISGDFGKGKPDPAIFEHALQLLGVTKDEAIMVGDNPNTDILGASKTGITSVWINHHDRTLTDVTPTYEIKNLGELLTIIEKLDK